MTCKAVDLSYGRPGIAAGGSSVAWRCSGSSRDRVAVVGPNCHRYLELYQAVPGAGMVFVPLNPRHTVAELRYALEDSGAKVLFTGEVTGWTTCVEHVVDLGDGYERLLAGRRRRSSRTIAETTLAGLFYTGGTTGASKGVMLTHRNLVANAMHYLACLPFTPEDPLADHRPAVPRRGLHRRAGHGLERAAATSSCRRSTRPPRST